MEVAAYSIRRNARGRPRDTPHDFVGAFGRMLLVLTIAGSHVSKFASAEFSKKRHEFQQKRRKCNNFAMS